MKRALFTGLLAAVAGILTTGIGLTGEAADLAGGMARILQDGDTTARMRMTIEPVGGGERTVLQIRSFSRRGGDSAVVLQRILWPAARKGEAVMVRQEPGRPAGAFAWRPGQTGALEVSATSPLWGGDLTHSDLTENFFLWPGQELVGGETIGRVNCRILESRPAAGQSPAYGKIRSWIDPERMVALRIVKFDKSGRPALEIEAGGITRTEGAVYLPAELTFRRTGSGTVTIIEGSGLRREAGHPDALFDPAAMGNVAPEEKQTDKE